MGVGWVAERAFESFHLIARLSDADLLVSDAQTGSFIDCNRSAHQRLGYTREELLALTPEQLQADPDHDATWVAERLEQLRLTGGGAFPTTHRCKDGSVLEVEVNLAITTVEQRQVMVSVIVDRTRQNRRERQLLALKAMHEGAEALVGSGSWVYTRAADAMRWSPQMHRICETDPDTVPCSRDTYETLVHPDDRIQWQRDWQLAVERGELFESRHRLRFLGGRIKQVLARGLPHYDSDGRLLEVVGTLEDITGRQDFLAQIEQSRFVDALTGLPNKAGTLRELERLLRARGYNQTLGVISLDLDGFQEINDLFGPEVGDQLLRAFSRSLRRAVPAADWVGRLSSDEFVVLRQQNIGSFGDVIGAARDLQATLCRQAVLLAQVPMNPTVCVGVSSYPEHGSEPVALLQCANTALMEAKRQGRSQLRAYSTALSRQIRDRIELDNQLAQAIEARQLRLLVQPQVDRAGRLVGGEALLRWVNGRGVTVPPSQFIPVAEQSGLIFQISEWVLAELAARMAEWRGRGLPLPPLAMNVSARQLESTDRRLLLQLTQVLEQHGLEPAQLELEITETALLRNPLQAREQLRLLADQGFRIAIDDFGTGYSSLDLLRTLPVHKLKIDQTFTRMLTAAPEDQAIVRATLTLARGLGMACIAEGVETEEQRSYLAELGCELYQGYLCGRPMELEVFAGLLQRSAAGDDSPRPDDGMATTVPLKTIATTFEQLQALRGSLDLSLDAQMLLQASYGPAGDVVDFVVLEANLAACRRLRDERENVIGSTICTMFPNVATNGLLRHYAACLSSRTSLELDNFIYDNHEFFGETRVYDLRAYPSGDLLSVTWRDVTDRYNATRQLAESAELYRLLAENIVEVILLVGLDERVRWVSPSLTSMIGWRQGDWIGRRFEELFATAAGDPQPVALQGWLQDYGRVRQGRLRLLAPSGRWAWVELSVRRIQGDGQRSTDPLGAALAADGALREGYVITLETADEKVSSERRLRRLATTDALTGLRNRQEVLDWLERRIGDGSGSDGNGKAEKLALLFCDFDDFKLINDTHGHEAGDVVLKAVAQRLRASIRERDLAARIGGDEFLVVLDGVETAADALAVAEKLRLAASEPVPWNDLQLRIGLSVGVALHASGESADLLLRRADRSMYAAKQQGRNRVTAL